MKWSKKIIKQTERDQNMTPHMSEKIKVVSFLSIVVVFFIHSTFPEEPYNHLLLPVVVRKCTAGIFGPCAVPMFYTISGYLFFREIKGLQTVFTKIRRRIRTLLIPFVIAALYYPAFFVFMKILPGVGGYIDRPSFIEMFKNMKLTEILCSLFYGASDGWPWAYHLWFMRDLLMIVFLSPIIYIIRKQLGYWIIPLILLLFLIFSNQMFLYAMFWFVSGSLFLRDLEKLPRGFVFSLLLSFFILSIYRQIYGEYSWKLLKVIEISMGIISFWCIYDYITNNRLVFVCCNKLKLVCQFTFFLYLYHEPIFHIIVKIVILVLGANPIGYTVAIIFPPILIIILGVVIGLCLKKRLPRLYYVITGGR